MAKYGYCPIQKKVVPVNEIQREGKAIDLFSSDEMPPTKHPITGEYFTSRQRFRAVTKAHGYEEVGTEYESGRAPRLREQEQREITKNLKEVFYRTAYNKDSFNETQKAFLREYRNGRRN